MAFGDGIFVVGSRSKQLKLVTHTFHSGVRFFILAAVIFHFAGTGFEKLGQENHKITSNLGFYLCKS
jgi:hypothetical protein